MRRALALCTVLALLPSCVLVSAPQRGLLSKRCMQFNEDSDEQVLENHLVDSREGSSGARGARGGGCGCN
ncbi:MAG: DUF4266 domain-containing protein [Myxococcales bacterium]|nr:DUF4266 domain-containing protein [Myxococcales bacterium]